jgi:hypothetical protein
MDEYLCVDCGKAFEGRPYYTGGYNEHGVGDEPICAPCAGEFLCPDHPEDATHEHKFVCVSQECYGN